MVIAVKYISQHERIKKNISNSYQYSKPNFDRFHKFRKFVFETSLSDDQKNLLKLLEKPIIEFNICEAYLSRLLGEFAKHEPSVSVRRAGNQQVPANIIEMTEGHTRHVLYEANKNSFSYEIYKDLLSGGFSVAKIWTEYASPMSFDQVIRVDRAFDPTLCGFDPMARAPHKADGQFCFELYPMTIEDFKRKYPGFDVDKISFTRNIEGFNWSYKNTTNEGILLIGEYFEKKRKREKIVKLANGRVILEKKYEEYQKIWNDRGFIEQFPVVVGKSRFTELETICRYTINENDVIKYEETDYSYLPRIFIPGSRIFLRQGTSNTVYEMTKPYVYHAEGLQNLKNFAGQTLANSLENMVQHKWIVKKEAIPTEKSYIDAITNPQKANTVVVNAYCDNDPDKPIPDPIREVQMMPAPPEVMATFTVTDQISQMILGSFDAALGINDNQLSGVAIQEAATQTNAAAMPFITGYLQGLTQIACCIVDLIPKYITTPRSIPVIDKKGKTKYSDVNDSPQSMMDYDRDSLQVEVVAGVSYEIQKNQSLTQIIALMQASPAFAQFMNSSGLMILIKNLTIHGQDQLEELSEEYMEQMKIQQQQAQQMQQQAMQNDPRLLAAKAKIMDVQQKAQQNQFDNKVKVAQVSVDKQRADTEGILAQAQVSQAQTDTAVQLEKSQTEREVHMLDAAAKMAEHSHNKTMDHHESLRKTIELHHQISQADIEPKGETDA